MIAKPTANVSIIAANYNNASFLEAFIESVIQSSVHPKELIIVDDGSSDDSREILTRYTHLSFLRTIFFESNKGFTTALNTALEAATGKYIMRADPDDLFEPERISKQLAYLEQNPNVDMLGSNAIYFKSDNGKYINKSNFPLSHKSIVQAYKKGEHGLLHATVCGKAEIYKKYRYQKISPGEDYELFARMARDGFRLYNMKESLYRVRIHINSSTANIAYRDIKKTFSFRDNIFKVKTTWIWILMYYIYIKSYRKFQISNNIFVKYSYLFISILIYPKKILSRICRKLFNTPCT